MISRLAALALVTVSFMSAEVYELRTYYCLPGRLDALNARFKNHTVKLFEKHGMTNVGYWVPQDEPEKGPKKSNTLIYIIKHKSREAAKENWDAFRKDPDWVKARDASEKDGKIVERVESVFMDAVPYSMMK
jgi:hypothetical protein